jgi:hypothetical protein
MLRLLLLISVLLISQVLLIHADAKVDHRKDYSVIEFRRYTIKDGERERFGKYFENYFPEAFQQLGAIAFGQFLERNNTSTFTWLRGFKNYDDRATINTAFYTGEVWKEHSVTMNKRIDDIQNVLLLRPLTPERGILVLPTVDPVKETNGAQGIVIAQIFAAKQENLDGFIKEAETTFAKYRDAGIREAGVLVTLDVKNNFPALPFRTDGPFLVWLGIVHDNGMLEQVNSILKDSAQKLSATGLLRNTPELIIMDPTSRSRLRWMPEQEDDKNRNDSKTR